jgi:hypothetical protein
MLATTRARCATTLGEALCQIACLEGQALTRAAAVGYALGDTDPFDMAGG